MSTERLAAAIFDVDWVLLASPHERAWPDALAGLADPARFTTALYQAHVAGKPRLAGPVAALEALSVADRRRHPCRGTERDVDIAVLGFAGLSCNDEGIRLQPQLSAAWQSLTYRMQWRSRHILVAIEGQAVRVTPEAGDPMVVTIGSERSGAEQHRPYCEAPVEAWVVSGPPARW